MNKKYLILLILVVLAGNLSASFTISNNISYHIEKNYAPGENLQGWINISFKDEPVNLFFNDSFGNKIKLRDIISTPINSNYKFSCDTIDCTSTYSQIDSAETTKSFSLMQKESKIIGFKLSGSQIASIDYINFTLFSDAPSSCINQLEIDILDDGIIDYINTNALDTIGCYGQNYGCFDKNYPYKEEYDITETPFCQRITLPNAPGFILRAWIKGDYNPSTTTDKIKLDLRKLTGEVLEECSIDMSQISSSGSEQKCNVHYSVTQQQEYYICLYKEGNKQTFKTRGYEGTQKCGIWGNPPKDEIAAYEISAQAVSFNRINFLNILNSLRGEETFGEIVKRYIEQKYDSNCAQGCIIPIRLSADETQNIIVGNLTAKYSSLSGPTETHNLYILTETPSTINSDFQQLYLDDSDFKVPSEYGTHTFTLTFDDEEILSKEILVQKMAKIKSLTPTTTSVAYPTTFMVELENNNVTNYEWDFGDNSTKVNTNTNKVTHTYNLIDWYNLTIKITDANKFNSTKTFQIWVGSAANAINTTIKEKQAKLKKLNSEIKNLPQFQKDIINSFIDLQGASRTIAELQRVFLQGSESKYVDILTQLLAIELPSSIITFTKIKGLPSIVSRENIYPSVLQEIEGEDYEESKAQQYSNAIFVWNIKNIETELDLEEIIIDNPESEDIKLNIITFHIKNKDDSVQPYLILKKTTDARYDKNITGEASFYDYFKLKKGLNTITLVTSEEIDESSLNYFISPALENLELTDEGITDATEIIEKEKSSARTLFILIFFFLIILGLIVYIILQQWYKNKYESALFKNRNHLYNLITYIENSKKKGMKMQEIKNRLKKAGWNSEQISYVMKKYEGKRTGMVEIPINKILNKFKKQSTSTKIPTSKYPPRRYPKDIFKHTKL